MRWSRDPAKEFVVVADFETAAADSQIADMLTDVTRRALSASRSLGAVPDARVVAARQRNHVPAEKAHPAIGAPGRDRRRNPQRRRGLAQVVRRELRNLPALHFGVVG